MDKSTILQYALRVCKAFVSLKWLDGSINFVFRFVAKISEVLLAIGIVISAADFLTHGRLMQNNVALADAWAWTQAIAIESSAGVVVLYALEAKNEQDYTKAWMYAILALLLAIVGGVMLFTQIVYSTTGIDVVLQMSMQLAISLAIARTFVSIAYVAMCRIKHVRLSGNEPTSTPTIDIHTAINDALATAMHDIHQQLQEMQQHTMQVVVQEVKRTVIEEVTQAKMIAMPKQRADIESDIPIDKNTSIALEAVRANPDISYASLATLLGYKDARSAKPYKQHALELLAHEA